MMPSPRAHPTEIMVLATGLAFPEGPAFAPDGALWCVELRGGALARWSGGRIERQPVGGAPNGLAFDPEGRAWFCDAERNAVRCREEMSRAGGTAAPIEASSSGRPLAKPNDLAFDALGQLVFTCPGDSRRVPDGRVWVRDRGGEVRPVAEGLYFPNGLAFVDGGRALVVAETYRHRLWRGAWDAATATWAEPWPFAETGGPVGPDGMALGADGLLYVAIYGRGCVQAIDPDGHVAAVHAVPGRNPTNCTFDPSGRLGLVVTEAEHGQLLSYPELGPGAPLRAGAR